MRSCPSCAERVPREHRYCGACGASLESPSKTPTATERHSGPSGGRLPASASAGVGEGSDRAVVPATVVRSAFLDDPSGAARFLPGTVLARRYRVVGLLGRGGMGEVYRADDLKLGQPVALKFLSRPSERDPSSFRRFLNEVRLSRQVAHPNVCRVYDVGEFDGRHFLSMEYVDGEDLASLLRRIGRLPRDKATQIARQICLGLAAAHDQGILHRDLKPANVMIDGRGRVRITDFGLAALTDEPDPGDARAGTPAYMAPEQLTGTEVTVRSDLYAVGLVLYELFTGRRPFEADTPTALARLKRDSLPTHPSAHVKGLDPAVERIILKCLEKDPASRPASARSIAGALPGADPLEEAIAAGETPSPELVAEGGAVVGPRPGEARVAMAVALASLALLALLGTKTRLLSAVTLDKPQGYLVERAREVARLLPGHERLAHEAFGYEADPGADVSGESHGLFFWYRAADRAPLPARQVVTPRDPPPAQEGSTSVRLDLQGRLRGFASFPRGEVRPARGDPEQAWNELFAQAGLDRSAFRPVAPVSLPVGYADALAAWSGPASAEEGSRTLRVEAAALAGRPVYFRVAEEGSARAAGQARDVWSQVNTSSSLALFGPVLIVGVVLARRNLLQGRGDRKGAFRLAAFMFVLWLALGLVGSDHFLDVAEMEVLSRVLARACLSGAVFWVLYMALEPHARRYWPSMLVSWVRLLGARLGDALVGWHLLVGAACGCLAALVEHVGLLGMGRLGFVASGPGALSLQLRTLASSRQALAGALDLLDFAVTTSLQIVVILLVLRVALRRQLPAVVGLFGVMLLVFAGPVATLPGHAAIIALSLLVLFRFGLLALMSELFVFVLLGNFLISVDPASPFAPVSYLAGTIAFGIAFYGLRRTRLEDGGRFSQVRR